MKAYLDIVKKILEHGEHKKNRTGVDTLAIAGVMFEHDMSEGFPLMTTKNVPLRLVASELEFFIKGITDKQWLIERNNHIWDEWCTPDKVPYSHDDEAKKRMREERDLGPIYGFQWRNFGAEYCSHDKPPKTGGVDQLKALIEKLKEKADDSHGMESDCTAQDGFAAVPLRLPGHRDKWEAESPVEPEKR